MTILREWRGRADPSQTQAVLELFQRTVKQRMQGAPGYLGCSFAKRDVGKLVEFILVSYWRDMDAMKAITGPAVDRAILPKEAGETLLDSDTFVRLYEILDQD